MATWKVYTYDKKSCEEHEIWTKGGMTLVRKTGFRWATFYVETNDNNPPEFEFDFVPGGNDVKDSIDMYNCCVNNIESSELEGMVDGCWEDFDWPEEMDDDEIERIQDLIEEHGTYEALEEIEGWSQDECQAWCWGPIVIEDEDGNQVRIIVADENGNAVDFEEDE